MLADNVNKDLKEVQGFQVIDSRFNSMIIDHGAYQCGRRLVAMLMH